MKQKLLFLMLFLIFMTGAFKIKAQSLVIREKNGTEEVKTLASVQDLFFSGSNLMLKETSSSVLSYSLADISKLYFNNVPVVVIDPVDPVNPNDTIDPANPTDTTSGTIENSIEKMAIYPNPVKELIYIKNLTEGNYAISIYRIDGSMVLQSTISSETNSIDVSNLQSGLYLIIINNQAFKFSKL